MSLATTDRFDTRLHDAAHAAERAAIRLADSADQAIRGTQRAANVTLDRLSDSVQTAKTSAVPRLERFGSEAEAIARRSLDAAHDRAVQLRDGAYRAHEQSVEYIREEPVKSVLIAAATGAAVMGLIALLRSSRRADYR